MSAPSATLVPALTGESPPRDLSPAAAVRRRLLDEFAAESEFWRGERVLRQVEDDPRRVQTDAAHTRNPDYQLGLLLAPAYASFGRHVLEHADRYDRIYFLSREGWMFMRMYHRLARALGIGDKKPRGTYLVANRRLSFLASMDELSLDEIGRMWWQYPNQSVRQLLRNLSLPQDPFFQLAACHGLADPDRPIRRPRFNKPFCDFLLDEQVQRAFQVHRDELRSLLRDYLRQRGFFDAGRVALVDVGWKGSIQTNLHRVARAVEGCPLVHGIYLGLQHIAPLDAEGSTRHGFLADTRSGDPLQTCILRNNSVFEMFATAPHGSVAGYERDARGRVHAQAEADPEEVRNFRGRFREVRRGIDDWFADYLGTPAALAAPAAELRPAVLDRLRRYLLYPTPGEARAFLEYSHVENFGVFRVTRYRFQGSRRRMLLARPLRHLPLRVLDTLRRQRWPAGVCKRSRIPFATFLFDLIETRRQAR